MSEQFLAYRAYEEDSGARARLERVALDDLGEGEVVIRGEYSSLNYKDALALTGAGKVVRRFPLVVGIDVAGTVASSADTRFHAGDPVVVTGCGLGETHDGGLAQYVRVPAAWVVPLPPGLSTFEAMALGTAGFTVALAVQRLEDNHQRPEQGPIAVSGATGGVGSLAVDILSGRGYEVHALSRKPAMTDYLLEIGARQVLNPATLSLGTRPLEAAQWGGAIDTVGSDTLGWLTRTVRPWGNIVSVGLAGGTELHTTVLPFILRGISLLGVSSAVYPENLRAPIWARLATDLRPRRLDRIVTETIPLGDLPAAAESMLRGERVGRTVVRLLE